MTTDVTLGQMIARRRQEAEVRSQARAIPAPRRRRPWTNYATVEDVNAAFAATVAEANAAFARRKEQADSIHQTIDQRLYYLERMMRRLTHPIRIPEGWLEIEDHGLDEVPSIPPDANWITSEPVSGESEP